MKPNVYLKAQLYVVVCVINPYYANMENMVSS